MFQHLATPLLFLNAITSKAVTAAAAFFVLYHRTPYAILFVVGALLNAAVGKLLKKLLNIRRPTTTLATPGMPSSHATSLSYFAATLTLTAKHFPTSIPFGVGLNDPTTMGTVTATYIVLIAFARVQLTQVHTVLQIVVGCILGSTSAICWFRFILQETAHTPLLALTTFSTTAVAAVCSVAASALLACALLFQSSTTLADALETLCCDHAKTHQHVTQRKFVLQELLQTEINYVKGLEFVAEHFVAPLLNDGDDATVDEVFNSWLPITKLHQDFLLQLKVACLIGANNGDASDASNAAPKLSTVTAARLVATTFSNVAPFFSLYIPYVEKYNTALSRISHDLRENGALSQQVDVALSRKDIVARKLTGGLGPLLALPFQRLCKYGLLLRELFKTFHPSGRTGALLHQAMQKVDAIVLKVNDAKARGENGERIFDIQEAMHDDKMKIDIPKQLRQPLLTPLLQPSRRLLYEGGGVLRFVQQPLPLASSFVLNGNGKLPLGKPCPQKYYFILFSDLLLIVHRDPPTKRRQEKLVLLHCIELTSLQLVRHVEGRKKSENDASAAVDSTTELFWARPSPWSGVAFGIVWGKDGKGAAFTESLRMVPTVKHCT